MRCLTRYGDAGANQSNGIKRPGHLVRIPYYGLLIALAAIYYAYVVSICLRWLVLQQGRAGLAFVLIAAFHVLLGMLLWSLFATVARGPGCVGEQLDHDGSRDVEELAGGQEREPLMEDNTGSHDRELLGAAPARRRRRAGSSAYSTDDEDEDGLELRPSRESGSGDDGDETEETSKGRKVEVIWPTRMSGGATLMAKGNGKARFCRKCKLPKPDRAHHCSTCGFCVLKMDHHCPWIGGCVGFKNYKPFILFLLYADMFALFVAGSSIWALIQVLDTDIELLGLAPIAWGFLVLFGFLFTLMLSGFFPYHLYLAMNNRTTIENMERNGRLLSLPAQAESALSAGTLNPHEAGLPDRPKDGMVGQLLPQQQSQGFPASHHSSRPYETPPPNPFLPDTPVAAQAMPSRSFEASASSSLSRLQRRQLERKAGRINIYDLGLSSANFEQAFGAKWHDWQAWVPVGRSKGSGYEYPVNKRHFDKLLKLNEQLRAGPRGC